MNNLPNSHNMNDNTIYRIQHPHSPLPKKESPLKIIGTNLLILGTISLISYILYTLLR